MFTIILLAGALAMPSSSLADNQQTQPVFQGQRVEPQQPRPVILRPVQPAQNVQEDDEEDTAPGFVMQGRVVQPQPAELPALQAIPAQGITPVQPSQSPGTSPAGGLQPGLVQPGTSSAFSQQTMTASMAALNADTVRQAVAASPLFLAELDYRSMSGASALAVPVADGAVLDLPHYLRSTDLGQQPEIAAIIRNPRVLGAIGPAEQRNEVYLLQDRLIVSRQVTVNVARNTCDVPARTQSQTPVQEAWCLDYIAPGERTDFSRVRQDVLRRGLNPADLLDLPPTDADIAAEAAELRAQLRSMRSDEIYAFDITAAEALRMSDEALIALELNGDEREVTYISVIPLDDSLRAPIDFAAEPVRAPPARLDPGLVMDLPMGPEIRQIPEVFRPHVMTRQDLMPSPRVRYDGRLPGEAMHGLPGQPPFTPLVMRRVEEPTLALDPRLFRPERATVTQSHEFHFLTGFTIERSIEDRYKVTFNKKKNYFVAFQYSVGFAIGLRFPFEVTAQSTEIFNRAGRLASWQSDNLHLQLAARGVSGGRDRTSTGGSVYLASGLPQRQQLDDQEYVFRIWAGCQLQIRAPVVKTVRINCPSVNIPPRGECPGWACAQFRPPLAAREPLFSFYIPEDVTRLQINAWIARAGLRPGAELSVRDANLAFNLAVDGGRFETEGGLTCASTNRSSANHHNSLVNPSLCSTRFYRPMTNPRQGMNFRVRANPGDDVSLILSDPVYRFTLVLTPFIEVFARLDIAVARWEVTHRFDIPGLALSRDFRFNRHEGTRREAIFGLCNPGEPRSAACRNADIHITSDLSGPG